MSAPSDPPAAAPIAIVGPHLTDGDFTVKDVEGNDVFRVKGVIFSMRGKRVLEDAVGNPLITMQQKLWSAHSWWNVFRGDSIDDSDLLFTAKRSSLFQLKTKLDVFLAANTKDDVCDFRVKGATLRMKKYTVKSMILGKDSFGVTIYPNVDHAFIVALIVILDEINKESAEEARLILS
ncbi:unnamed protein product [Spirodela intermedia]|uniref:Uncharacterized protein n=1 Tax=Spirodela intermedia TaxID=51605 RepID=A0A7I8IAB1_SPIIN|nr:unnamed protein product [Spirodela intermedia]CAA6654667.1 unnamed protein product [Spirodela intermedia]